MKKLLAFFAISLLFILLFQNVNARVDAEYIIKSEDGRQIFMITPQNKIIFGNVVVGQEIVFDASASNSMYKINKYYWDFDGDGKWDRIANKSITTYVYKKAGIYNATLMAVATSAPPYGDGDVVKHEIKVVKRLIPPTAQFVIIPLNRSIANFIFNASQSYDKDGYIKAYYWDFDGDGKWDTVKSTPTAKWEYKKNGYYVIKLKVMDYDLKTNETKRVIKIDWLNGSINEIKREIKIENRCSKKINVSIMINNDGRFNTSIRKNYVINVSLNTGLNEIFISSERKNALFIFSGKPPTIIINNKKIYISNNKLSPGYETIALFLSIMILFLIKKKKGMRN